MLDAPALCRGYTRVLPAHTGNGLLLARPRVQVGRERQESVLCVVHDEHTMMITAPPIAAIDEGVCDARPAAA